MAGIYGTQIAKGKFDLMQSLFGIPFLLGSLVLIPITLMTIFGKLVVRSSGDQGGGFMGVGPLGWTRKFRWREIKMVRTALTKWKQNERSLPLIELDGAKPIRFGSQLSEKRRDFLLAVLRRSSISPPVISVLKEAGPAASGKAVNNLGLQIPVAGATRTLRDEQLSSKYRLRDLWAGAWIAL